MFNFPAILFYSLWPFFWFPKTVIYPSQSFTFLYLFSSWLGYWSTQLRETKAVQVSTFYRKILTDAEWNKQLPKYSLNFLTCGVSHYNIVFSIKFFLNEYASLVRWHWHICMLNGDFWHAQTQSYDALTSKSHNCASYMQNHRNPNNNLLKYLCHVPFREKLQCRIFKKFCWLLRIPLIYWTVCFEINLQPEILNLRWDWD